MWSDVESDKDYLNFGEVSDLVVDILSQDEMLPVSIGIFGNWGSGKSSLLRLIEKNLKRSEENSKDWIIVKFDAWLYQGYDDARASLLEEITNTLIKAANGNESLTKKAKNLFSKVSIVRTLGLTAEGIATLLGVPTGGIIARGIGVIGNATDGIQNQDEYESLHKLTKEVQEQAKGLVKESNKKSPPQQINEFRKEYSELLKELRKPLVIIIDNLDRCLPTNAIHTLEAIRLFLFLENTAFIIAADKDMIQASVAEHFKGSSVRHQIDYLDKLIQIPIYVPKAGILEIRSYLFMLYAIAHKLDKDKLEKLRAKLEEELQQSWKNEPVNRKNLLRFIEAQEDNDLARAFENVDRIASVLANAPNILGNPRIVKRLLNTIKMRLNIANRRKIPLDEAVITKIAIFERCTSTDAVQDLYHLIDQHQGTPTLLKDLELDEKKLEDIDKVPQSWKDNKNKTFISEWLKQEPKLGNIDLKAAIYLSRETIPISFYIAGLSPKGQEILSILLSTDKQTSPTTQKTLKSLSLEEQIPVMEGLINQLRQVSDWIRQPKGFAGACLLAQESNEAAQLLYRFINQLKSHGDLAPWFQTKLENEQWYKELN